MRLNMITHDEGKDIKQVKTSFSLRIALTMNEVLSKIVKVVENSDATVTDGSCELVLSFTNSNFNPVQDHVEQIARSRIIERVLRRYPQLYIGVVVYAEVDVYPTVAWVLQPTRDVQDILVFLKDYKYRLEVVDRPNLGLYVCSQCLRWRSSQRWILMLQASAYMYREDLELCKELQDTTGVTHLTLDDPKTLLQNLKQSQARVISCLYAPRKHPESIDFCLEVAQETDGFYLAYTNKNEVLPRYIDVICKRLHNVTLEYYSEADEELQYSINVLRGSIPKNQDRRLQCGYQASVKLSYMDYYSNDLRNRSSMQFFVCRRSNRLQHLLGSSYGSMNYFDGDDDQYYMSRDRYHSAYETERYESEEEPTCESTEAEEELLLG